MVWKPDYVTAADVQAYLRVDDAADNAQFGMWATAASRAVDRKCNRQFGSIAAPAPRTYRRPAILNPQSGLYELEIDDVQTSVGLLVGGVAYASSGAVLLPDNAPAEGLPWERLGFTSQPLTPTAGAPVTLVITAQWGWTAVPPQVVGACYMQASRWAARRDSPFGVAGSPDQGSEIRLLARLDPDVATTLTGLSRRRRVG